MVNLEMCDGICYSFILAYFAAHDDKDIFWLAERSFGFLSPEDYWYQYYHMRH